MPSNSSETLQFPTPVVEDDPIVITGVGLGTSLGSSREEVWQAIQTGKSGVRLTKEEDQIGPLRIPCAMVDWLDRDPNQLKSIQISRHVADEALSDSKIDFTSIDRTRFGCSISAQFGDIGYCFDDPATRDSQPARAWWNEFLPCSVTSIVANEYGLQGPRVCHTTACASGLVSLLAGIRMLKDDQADFALCGAADAISELIIASFHRMGVLSTGPTVESACRPFDRTRSGFVMGEGAALMVLEKRSKAIARGAEIYAELAACTALCQAHHVTGLDGSVECLIELIQQLVRKAGWSYLGPQYINAHGTGTEQNDRSEMQAIRDALGSHAEQVLISSNKAVMGHLINAAGSAELAVTAMAMRDGFAPPTMNLADQENIGMLDCLANAGEVGTLDRCLKLSLAFGGHLVGIAMRKSPFESHLRMPKPLSPDALIRRKLPQTGRRAA
ncbi:MAG: beta-ketoacyl-[acyl-carrier-protein] synthase family protein [Planctomycetota bacterium]